VPNNELRARRMRMIAAEANWYRARRHGIDPVDRGMAVRRAHDDGVQLAGRVQIVDKAPVPGQEPPVLEPRQRSDRPIGLIGGTGLRRIPRCPRPDGGRNSMSAVAA